MFWGVHVCRVFVVVLGVSSRPSRKQKRDAPEEGKKSSVVCRCPRSWDERWRRDGRLPALDLHGLALRGVTRAEGRACILLRHGGLSRRTGTDGTVLLLLKIVFRPVSAMSKKRVQSALRRAARRRDAASPEVRRHQLPALRGYPGRGHDAPDWPRAALRGPCAGRSTWRGDAKQGGEGARALRHSSARGRVRGCSREQDLAAATPSRAQRRACKRNEVEWQPSRAA